MEWMLRAERPWLFLVLLSPSCVRVHRACAFSDLMLASLFLCLLMLITKWSRKTPSYKSKLRAVPCSIRTVGDDISSQD